MRIWLGLLIAIACAAPAAGAGHPRLIVNQSDVARLRSWAVNSNPMWSKGLVPLSKYAKSNMNQGLIKQDMGLTSFDTYPTELYAELFAFMSIVHPSAAARKDYGKRARKILMPVLKIAARGRKAGQPFRDPLFSTGDRSRFYGEAWPLAVDWAYRYFSKKDKMVIRKVFLRWAKEQYQGYPLDQLSGRLPTFGASSEDPTLLSERHNVRSSLNNYYLGHARQLGLMAMALDPADDPGGQLRSNVESVVGQWLFVIDKALRDEATGGLSPEGFEYGPDATGRIAQLLLALRTAGEDGSTAPRALIESNPFWNDSIVAYLHSLPPVPTKLGGQQKYLGQIWQAASFGDEESYWALDPISLYGPLGIEAMERGDAVVANATRWIAMNVAPGGKEQLYDRVGNTQSFTGSILYFLLFDPSAPEPTDPRGVLPLRHVAPGAEPDDGAHVLV